MTNSPTNKQLKEFGYLIGLGFPILIGWLLPTLVGHGFRTWTLWVGIPGLILGLIAPHLLRKPYKAWMTVGHALGWINSQVILGLVYIIILQPIAFIVRLFGHDPLRRKKHRNIPSYREERKDLQVIFNRMF